MTKEKLIDLSRRFIVLIDHEEPGLATWHIAVQEHRESNRRSKRKTKTQMKTIRFTAYPDGYRCSEPGDCSDNYVRLYEAKYLLLLAYDALRACEEGTAPPQLAQKTANTIASHLLL